MRQAAEQASFSKVQAVTAPTQRLLDAMAGHGLDPAIARVIPNPIPVVPPSASWRIDQANQEQILFVGRFDLCKGADVAIRAFAYALAQRPTLRLVMVGPDRGLARSDGRLMHFDEFVASEISPQVRERIEFVDEQPPERIAELRLQSGFALVASRFEASSYALTEAMASGMPALASSCAGPSEIIQDKVNGRLVPVGDVAAMAGAMVEMADSPSLLAAMGRAAYSWVADRLSPDRIARETVAVYREAIRRC